MIRRLAVIGVGLIGGSLALALRRAGAVGEVIGAGRSRDNLELARERGIVDRYTTEPAQAVAGADMVVVATALGATAEVLGTIAGRCADDAVLTDVGSAKGSVIDAARAALGDDFGSFVPGHPIAGTENSGAGAAFAELYERHKVILTPVAETRPAALERVRAMWTACGASVVDMDAAAHDRALAATSHLPHLLAYNLVDTLARRADAADVFEFAAGGFRDFTRIASSSPSMWTQIALANRDALLESCAEFAEHYAALVAALEQGDAAALERAFGNAKRTRDALVVPESNERR
ncbi:MAG: prephenate dehydrogenase [Gammaproteobacteria bacterium]